MKQTPDQIVDYVISSARLEGGPLTDETISVVRKIASGEMTRDEMKAWQRTRVAEIQSEARSRK
ncbi:hypothetical protein E0J16_00075 [Rhizobium pisi]|uniref:antitoxin VbhA family protein n=1 Tax=Rhizobium pisi TaxID=574561 RepID=UPI00103EF38F|nr:antitoxin VbhA family protein [Rhizobium pisi]TCA62719.1 hypothetical protein E0J16_00075 [Rhizobium pisi]